MILQWSRRVLLACIILISLYASIQNLISTRDLGGLTEDPVADFEQRFIPLKARLPFQRGVVGYISNADVPGASFDSADEQGEYVLVQYVMAPIIIVRGTDQEWNIGNLSREAYRLWNQSNQGQFDVTPLKDNIYLIHRLKP